jgi:cyclophilin family peptidyl-prolyl cis-trans isomerase
MIMGVTSPTHIGKGSTSAHRLLIRVYGVFLVAVSTLIMQGKASAEHEPPFELPARSEVLKIRSAILETSQGKLYFELLPEEAPWHVANFKYLADKGFYNGLSFHLYMPGYLIQGGDPRGNGSGGPGYVLPAEFSERNHRFGTLGMARIPDGYTKKKRALNPQRNSNGSQLHILLADAPHMDGRYTVFGKLTAGQDVLARLRKGDSITKLTVYIREGGR